MQPPGLEIVVQEVIVDPGGGFLLVTGCFGVS